MSKKFELEKNLKSLINYSQLYYIYLNTGKRIHGVEKKNSNWKRNICKGNQIKSHCSLFINKQENKLDEKKSRFSKDFCNFILYFHS
jgi:hypothetical protein